MDKINFLQNVAEHNISVKALMLSGSSTMVTFGVVSFSYESIFLGVAGFMISIMSFYYDYTHAESKKKTTALLSEAVRHLLFGTFAFPAFYSYLKTAFDFPIQMVIFLSVVLSYSVMVFVPFIIDFFKNFAGGKK